MFLNQGWKARSAAAKARSEARLVSDEVRAQRDTVIHEIEAKAAANRIAEREARAAGVTRATDMISVTEAQRMAADAATVAAAEAAKAAAEPKKTNAKKAAQTAE
ncbi:hypothetical protein [Methylobacterium ajmalii]|uniref:hypothetical protein n=1 Tax=Methylobacterium ajmalii TaxID=2738439 RepID=UPI002F34F19B